MGILSEIVSRTKEKIQERKARVSISDLKSLIGDIDKPLDFTTAIKRRPGENIKLIAEIKRASPSRGIIRADFDHLSIAKIFEKKSVNAISVLTEEDFFLGHLRFLREIRNIVTKPVLRKDFICDEYQIYESRAHGADALLLIASILDKKQAEEYLHMAAETGLHVIFEIHDLKELEMALLLNSPIIGINNRNLKTLRVDIHNAIELKRELPPGKIVVSESGIKTREDVTRLEEKGIDALLVGTALMEADDIGKKVDEFTGQV